MYNASVLNEFWTNLPPQFITFFVAMLPVVELRGAIPLAIFQQGLSAPEAFIWAVLGNSLVGAILVLFLEPVSNWLRRFKIFDRFFNWLFERTRKNHSHRFQKSGLVALFLFVAIPLPMTGAWTGAAAAFVFGVEKKSAIITITLGVITAGIIVTLVCTGALQLGSFFSNLFAPHS